MSKKSIARSLKALLWILVVLMIPACTGDGGSAFLGSFKRPTGHKPWVWQNPLPVGNHLGSVSFGTTSNGWAVGDGGAIISTRDGGATWKAAANSDSRSLRDVSAISSGRVWAVGDGGAIVYSSSG